MSLRRRFEFEGAENSTRSAAKAESATEQTSSSTVTAQRSVARLDSDAPPYIQALYRTELFSRDEERAMFRLLAQRKLEADAIREQMASCADRALVSKLAAIEGSIVEVRNAIIEANLRLVVSVAKRFVNKGQLDLTELISEGNSILIRAVDLFDAEFGTRFSTYATTALQRAFMSTLKTSHRRSLRFTTGAPDAFETIEDESSKFNALQQLQAIKDAKCLLKYLNDRERFIVEGRFGIRPGSKPKTYRELGEALGLSKERVRQVLIKSMATLREIAENKKITPPEAT